MLENGPSRSVVVAGPASWPEMRQAASAFSERDRLDAFFVSFDAERNPLLGMPGPLGRHMRLEARRRQLSESALRSRVREVAWGYDVAAAVTARATGRSGALKWVFSHLFRAFDKAVSRAMPPSVSLFVGYYGACAKSLRAARERGATTVVNWNVPHWSLAQLEYSQEYQRDPEWARTFAFPYWIEKLQEQWEAELAIADYILTPSRLVVNTFEAAGYDTKSILRIPYGVDLSRFSAATSRVPKPKKEPLNVLYVGELGQRKGVSYVMDVARRLPDTRFRLRGARMTSLDLRPPENVEVLPPTVDIASEFMCADVLLFPSLYDGFGLVILEALACGLPVITTANAGGADVIREGVDGYVVQPRDVDAMVQRIAALNQDRDLLANMGISARSQAEKYPWERYRTELAECV